MKLALIALSSVLISFSVFAEIDPAIGKEMNEAATKEKMAAPATKEKMAAPADSIHIIEQ